MLLGGAGNDTIYAYDGGDDTVDAGAGIDKIFVNGTGVATVLFGRGNGPDTVVWTPSLGGTLNVRFKDGITAQDLVTYRGNYAGNVSSLVIGIAGTADFIEIYPYPYADAPILGTFNPVILQFANGSSYTPLLTGIGQYTASADSSSSPVTLVGTAAADIIYASRNQTTYVHGGDGDDVVIGLSSGYVFGNPWRSLSGDNGNDFILGGYYPGEELSGGDGNDTLDGNTDATLGNADRLYGGAGSNTYIFGKGYGNDVVYATRPSGGTDTQTVILKDIAPSEVVLTRITGVEVDGLRITVSGTLNSLEIPNFFIPDSIGASDYSVDQLKFADGTVWSYADILTHVTADTGQVLYAPFINGLQGGSGNDTLYGTIANDYYFDGGAGDDLSQGGLGDDSYHVRDAGDQVVEFASEGVDHVYAYLSWTLAPNIENLTLETPQMRSSNINGMVTT